MSSFFGLEGGVYGANLYAHAAALAFLPVNAEFSQLADDYSSEFAFNVAGAAAYTLLLIDKISHFKPFLRNMSLAGSLFFVCFRFLSVLQHTKLNV